MTLLSILLASVGIFQIGCLWQSTRGKSRTAPFNSSLSISNYNTGSAPAFSISVCIPAIPRDVDSGCLEELIYSIKRQTVSAAEVIISFSNATYPEAQHVRTLARETVAPVPVKVLRSTEVCVQGKSRNNAVLASTAEIISFIDADDKMHPHRLEAIQEAFREHRDLRVLLHGYVESKDEFHWESKPMLTPSAYAVVGKEEICKSELRSRHQPHLDLLVHHAHVTVKRTVFEEFSYDESPESYRIEDSLFVRDVVAAACSRQNVSDLLFLKAPLSLYRSKSATCNKRDD